MLMANHINTVAIMVNFMVNQDYIAKTLCVQKDNQKGCNGKCQLGKQLTKNNPDPVSEIPVQENKRMTLDVYFVTDISRIDSSLIQPSEIHNLFFYKQALYFEPTLHVDSPPPISA